MTKRRNWSNDDIEFLKDNVGKLKISTLSERLGRTEESIKNKLKRLGISNTKAQTGFLTTYELAKLVQKDATTVRAWITKHGLNSTKKVTRCSRRFYFIEPEDFWKWAEDHKEKIDFSKIEPHTIIPEPNWVEHERKCENPTTYKVWSIREERQLRLLMMEGYSIYEVANKLERSVISVKRKYSRLEAVR
ncbi:DNA-binding protein [Metabacillus malikii]|uniref:Transcriptional regulator n=1 Tax=Metabacillus malikii TaxID=1504265 RepID=A0ABT9ZMR7_9BACI|nr:DNA-binding protein [Metabacillus malikii]MDQ0233552.1 putative transcriptional regulator [Metabacillus malikii]